MISEAEEPPGETNALAALAAEAGAAHEVNDRPRKPETLERVRAFDADLFVLAGYTRILPPALIEMPRRGVVNLHGGRIPDYRGCAPIPWQILRGETTLGLTVLYADAGIDTGDVLAEETYELAPEEGATEAVARTLERFPVMLVNVLRGLEAGTLQGRPQDLSAGAYYTRRHPEDGAIDCCLQTAEEIFHLIRALRSPYPGAFAWRGNEQIVLQRARLLEETVIGVPGHVPLKRPDGVVLCARDRGLLVTEVREGESLVPARDRLRTGDRLRPTPA